MAVSISPPFGQPPTGSPLVDRNGMITGGWQVYFSEVSRVLGLRTIARDTEVDPPDLGSGATTQVVFSLPGARARDFARASFDPPNAGMLLFAHVTADDEVTVTFWNISGGNINLPEGTLRVLVEAP